MPRVAFLRRPARRGPGVGGATIAVRSLRSGLPRAHPRCRLRRLPSDSAGRSYTPRPPQAHAAPGFTVEALRALGRIGFLRFLHAFVWDRSSLRRPSPFGRAGGLR